TRKAATLGGLFGRVLVRAIPFGVLSAWLRLLARLGLGVLAGATAVRLATAGVFLGWGLGDWTSVRSLVLLPLRDLAGLVSWLLAFLWPNVIWRGEEFVLGRDGRLTPKERGA